MADRIAAAGGILRIHSAPGLGTTVSGRCLPDIRAYVEPPRPDSDYQVTGTAVRCGQEKETAAMSAELSVASGRVGHTGGPDALRALDVFIGRWITQGATEAAPGQAPLPIVCSDVYEWAAGWPVRSAQGRWPHR